MTDERVREADRRARSSDAISDEARVLLERVRAGALTWGQLELGAYWGDAASRLLVEAPMNTDAELKSWVRGLAAFGKEAGVRAGLAAAEHALAGLKAPYEAESEGSPVHAVIAAIRAWLREPGPVSEARAKARSVEAWDYYKRSPSDRTHAASAAIAAEAVVGNSRHAAAIAADAADEALWWREAPALEAAACRRAIEAALCTWALRAEG